MCDYFYISIVLGIWALGMTGLFIAAINQRDDLRAELEVFRRVYKPYFDKLEKGDD